MPAKQRVWLNNVKGLFPETGKASEQNEAETVVLGEQRPFHLTMSCCRSKAFSTIRSERLRVRSEMTLDIKDSVAGLAHCLIFC